MDVQIEIEAAGFPEDVEKAIDVATEKAGPSSAERQIADVLKAEVRTFNAKAYLRLKCSIDLEQGGSNE